MRKLILAATSCVVLMLAGCGGDEQYYGSNYSESNGGSTGRTAYRSYDSSTSYETSARNSPPFGGYPVNRNATCETNCPGGVCREAK